MVVPNKVVELVKRFQANESVYRSPDYKEAHIRQDFIDPFFAELGWDLRNEQNASEVYKEVIFEDAIKVGCSTKAPDYCFRVGGNRKFFVEAKKPSVNLADSISAAFQVRRYGWSAKLPVSILTDFEEFAVYDCRVMPNKNDKSTTARSLYLSYTDYADRWNEIYDLFSKEAVLAGSLEQFADEHKQRKGTTTVDAAFLKEIETWRERLAIALSSSNPNLSSRELNFAVQMTINRLIFLRICEDRGIEPYEQLRSLTEKGEVYQQLCGLFRQADDRYNSGLFHFKPEKGRLEADEFTLTLTIPDAPLQQIIQNFYYPDSPYEFSVIPIEILGQVYEQFLGKVIRLVDPHPPAPSPQGEGEAGESSSLWGEGEAGESPSPWGEGFRVRAVIEDKPEVRKAGGVYYTPTYIVDYIVENTIGRSLAGKTPKQAEKIRVLDPACGSGSFLIGAYQFLLNWYLQQYGENPTKYKKQLYQGSGGDWRLTSTEKKRILLNHIHGVDIDLQAVETTKLSLLLKVLEGESQETLFKQLSLLQERALPDLEQNIKCGNSLIGSDYYDNIQINLLNEEELYRINVFDWEEGFPEIMQSGGFDVVIGNPPYVRQESLSNLKTYFEKKYKTYHGVADLYTYFIEKGLSKINPNGLFSIIVSSSFLRTTYAEPLRKYLKENASVLEFVDFGGLAVFANAKDTYVCIPLLGKKSQPQTVSICKVDSLQGLKLKEFYLKEKYEVEASQFNLISWSLDNNLKTKLIEKIVKNSTQLGEYVKRRFFRGVTTGFNEAFVITREKRDEFIIKDSKNSEIIKLLIGGKDIRRYEVNYQDSWLIFTRRGIDINLYPVIEEHLAQWKEELTPKTSNEQKKGRKPGRYKWYEIQDDVAYYNIFEEPKIVFPDIAKNPRFFLETTGAYVANTAYCLGTDDLYLLGVLNSKVFWFAISCISIPFGTRAGEFRYRLIYQYMEKIPIHVIDFNNPTEKAKHDRIVQLVEQMLALHQQLAEAKTPPQKSMIQKQINVSDRQIDQLVYELYELTAEEIAIVEGK
ncbi:N-6 DNA methylase [Leptolyngbyaceae cyanobacterium UHCC 1019]